MPYVKTIWNPCDTVTSQKLNKIEDELERISNGGVSGCFVVNILPEFSDDPVDQPISMDINTRGDLSAGIEYLYTDKSYNEIVNAFKSGSLPIGVFHDVQYQEDGGDERVSEEKGLTKFAPTDDASEESSESPEILSETYSHYIFQGASMTDSVYQVIFNFFGDYETFYSTDPDDVLTTKTPTIDDGEQLIS